MYVGLVTGAVDAERPRGPADEGRLARAELARDRDDIARLELARERRGDALRLLGRGRRELDHAFTAREL